MNIIKRFVFNLLFSKDRIVHNVTIKGHVKSQRQSIFMSHVRFEFEDERQGLDITEEIKTNYFDLIDKKISYDEFMFRLDKFIFNGRIEFFEEEKDGD